MSSHVSTPAADSPVAVVLNAPGSYRRVAAFLLSGATMFAPLVTVSSLGLMAATITTAQVGWAWLFPILAALALAAPAIPAAAPYQRVLDVASALAGASIVAAMVVKAFDSYKTMNAIATVSGLTSPQARQTLHTVDPVVSSSLGVGTYMLIAAILAALLAVFARRPSALAATSTAGVP